MKTNLSRLIKLDRVSEKYYSPSNEVEKAALSRDEKVYLEIYDSVEAGATAQAKRLVEIINHSVETKGKCVLALGAGNSTHPVYHELVRLNHEGRVSFQKVIVFNISEFYPSGEGLPTTLGRLRSVLLDHIDIRPENIRSIDTTVAREKIHLACREYEVSIERAGGIDVVVCEIGPRGNLAFNEPGTKFGSGCRLVLLGNQTRHIVASDYKCEEAPLTAVTLGISNLLGARHIATMAWGENYAGVIKQTVEGPVTDALPASFLQTHSHASIVVDLAAADELTRISEPWKVTSCEWDDKLIRRAIVWLCKMTGKPILKLTDHDYNDYGLGELLAIYGSAYNVNIKIFNDLQHTITGWPGGKPGADDSTRPERAEPYPKRVLVFSPHPDDDVISMGGTLKRLVDQGHDVHVAYETSGNIAVGDEDMMRYVMLMDGIADKFGFDTKEFEEKSAAIKEYVAGKKANDVDSPDIRLLKTVIRQCEARTACQYIGVKPENVHFLRLPFYETGAVKKGDLTQRDVDIVKKLMQDVKPNEMFVAGDLADPHGTHRVCLDAVLAAIDELQGEPWLEDCYVWMYRGAWAEWEIDHIEMAVPLSPEELRFKRNSILKHQSQMENAPYLGDDDRLFWQRAEERNRATAKLYEDLGLAAYEAIEAFVRFRQSQYK
ncbi:MAG: PIG-L family deacetylase [Muribaculaceae bacterium]|nr:PIG-L family deacetylase [Muribaculaceae bacterium]